MSNRFHSKFHRSNHHTYTSDTNADAGHDPIASSEQPFLGEFVLAGALSCVAPTSAFGGYFYSQNTAISAVSNQYGIDTFASNTAIIANSPLLGINVYGGNMAIQASSPTYAISANGTSSAINAYSLNLGVYTVSKGTGLYADGNNFGILAHSNYYAISGNSALTGIKMTANNTAAAFFSPSLALYASGANVKFDANTTVNGNLTINGDTTITGNLSALGNLTYLDTVVQETSAVTITNTGTGPALTVIQTGDQPIADFYDDTNIALHIDGRTAKPGYVGIKTLNPNKELTVNGTISASGDFYINRTISANGFYATGAYSGQGDGIVIDYASNTGRISVGATSSTDNLAFYNSGTSTNTMFISANGNVGIGTSSPDKKLTVNGDVKVNNNISASAINVSNGFYSTGAYSGQGDGIVIDYASNIGRISVGGGGTAKNIGFYSTGTTNTLFIDTNGNVGIGNITSPNQKLTINGSLSAINGVITLNDRGTNDTNIGNSSSTVTVSSNNFRAPSQVYTDGSSVINGTIGDSRYTAKNINGITSSVFTQKNTNTLADLPGASISLTSGTTYLVLGTVVSTNSTTGASGGVQIQLNSSNSNSNLHTFCNITVQGSVNGSSGNRRVTSALYGNLFNTAHTTSTATANADIANTFHGYIKPLINCTLKVTIAPINSTSEDFNTKIGSSLIAIPIA